MVQILKVLPSPKIELCKTNHVQGISVWDMAKVSLIYVVQVSLYIQIILFIFMMKFSVNLVCKMKKLREF